MDLKTIKEMRQFTRPTDDEIVAAGELLIKLASERVKLDGASIEGIKRDLGNLTGEGSQNGIKTRKSIEEELSVLEKKYKESTDINDKEVNLINLRKLIIEKRKEIEKFKIESQTKKNEIEQFEDNIKKKRNYTPIMNPIRKLLMSLRPQKCIQVYKKEAKDYEEYLNQLLNKLPGGEKNLLWHG